MFSPYPVERPLLLAPMAGVTDLPFRQLCLQTGADYVVTEMVKAPALTVGSSSGRGKFSGDESLRIVQIIGNDPDQMAQAARQCHDMGADIIDINMGCPAKKFARKPAGSALLADPGLVKNILTAVVNAVPVAVTLKIRTGIDDDSINAPDIGKLAEDCGIRALTVHGRTRAQRFTGDASHEQTSILVERLTIPVIANGDIDSPHSAERVLQTTGAAGLMLGRGARRNPFLFQQIKHYLETGTVLPAPDDAYLLTVSRQHLHRVHAHYPSHGLDKAARHLGWLLSGQPGIAAFRQVLSNCSDEASQHKALETFFADRACLGAEHRSIS